MARLLREVIDSGAPPQLARLPMGPEEVAASYAEAEEGTDDDPEFEGVEFDDAGEDDCEAVDRDGDDGDDEDGGGHDDDDEVGCHTRSR